MLENPVGPYAEGFLLLPSRAAILSARGSPASPVHDGGRLQYPAQIVSGGALMCIELQRDANVADGAYNIVVSWSFSRKAFLDGRWDKVHGNTIRRLLRSTNTLEASSGNGRQRDFSQSLWSLQFQIMCEGVVFITGVKVVGEWHFVTCLARNFAAAPNCFNNLHHPDL